MGNWLNVTFHFNLPKRLKQSLDPRKCLFDIPCLYNQESLYCCVWHRNSCFGKKAIQLWYPQLKKDVGDISVKSHKNDQRIGKHALAVEPICLAYQAARKV